MRDAAGPSSDAGVPPGDSTAARPTEPRRLLSVDEYADGVRQGNIAVLARALTLIESSNPDHQRLAEELLTRLLPVTGQAIRIGITGPPGVGKSTFIEAFGLHLVKMGKRVAVLAVDPSSAITGGSILGDKTRMAGLAAAPGAFIRPSPSAGTLGGIARKTRESMLTCEAAGYDVILIETVGVGQSETMVASITDCFVALMIPGAGDELQGIKRGLLEHVDVIAVNKADGELRKAAEVAAGQYVNALHSLGGHDAVMPTVLTCSAIEKRGMEAVWEAVSQRFGRLQESGELAARRGQQAVRWLWAVVEDRLFHALRENSGVVAIRKKLEDDVAAGKIPPEAAARTILETFGWRQPPAS